MYGARKHLWQCDGCGKSFNDATGSDESPALEVRGPAGRLAFCSGCGGSVTIERIENDVWSDPEASSSLISAIHRLRRIPIVDFTTEDLRLMIGQNLAVDLLIDRALAVLTQDPWASGDYYAGDLLHAVLQLPDSTFTEQARQYRLNEVLRCADASAISLQINEPRLLAQVRLRLESTDNGG